MLKSSARSQIRLRGVRQNNLKNFDLDLPLNQFIVITGLSGSGKSSLAFDTLFAEGQRRYIETFSPYARQFFDRMDKPRVDSIEGIPPAIAIEQRNAVKTTRSTVGTMTEICDYLKVLWPHIAQLHCRQCGRTVRKESPQHVWDTIRDRCSTTAGRMRAGSPAGDVLITFSLPLTEKLSLEESLALVARQGYQRILLDGNLGRLEDLLNSTARRPRPSAITVVQDRVKPVPANRARFIEACEQAYHFGKGRLAIHFPANAAGAESKSTGQRFDGPPLQFSSHFHCAACDLEYREPSPALFSFNHPVGACPACKGFGRVISIDYQLALPDRSRTLAEGVVKPWQSGQGIECHRDLLRMCRQCEIPTNVPFEKLRKRWQNLVIEGEPDYGKDEEHEWPRAWYGVKGYFRWLESRAYKMHVRVLLSRYRCYTTCPQCHGARFQPETLLYTLPTRDPAIASDEDLPHSANVPDASEPNPASPITLADFYALPIRDALVLIESIAAREAARSANEPIALVLGEVRSRLAYLNEVGLGYLTLDRPTRSLSGGETERVNLTTCLGTRLVNTLFVLDEPSVGLHPRDTERLVRILEQLRDTGNTVVVVEHERGIMEAADRIVDLGPGHGATGGQIVFQGTYSEILHAPASLTGQYLSGRKQIEIPTRRPVKPEPAPVASRSADRSPANANALALNEAIRSFGDRPAACPTLTVARATRHNLRDLTVEIPLGRFVCLTGVSGSGKTTLMRDVLLPLLETRLKSSASRLVPIALKASERMQDAPSSRPGGADDDDIDNGESSVACPSSAVLSGAERLGRVVLVDQSILGKTPRSNPAVYIGAFDDIREFFAQSEPARRHGLNASAFSFNSAQGQCERCRGAGFEKIEMQFLSDVFIRCPDCNGRRYREHIRKVKVRPGRRPGASSPERTVNPRKENGTRPNLANAAAPGWSIADLLDATVDEAIDFLSAFPGSPPARRAVNGLKLLQEVGLGYLCLGQPINTLSGGESQRLKLVRHLAESAVEDREPVVERPVGSRPSTLDPRPTLFLFDEPTTGLHFDDVRVLLKVFQRLVAAGHSVLVVEHNLDLIKSADWIIDLGPDAGDAGGQIVAQGTPEAIAACEASHTGRHLRPLLAAPCEAHPSAVARPRRAGESAQRFSAPTNVPR